MKIGIINSERVKREKMAGIDMPLEVDKSELVDPGLATAPSVERDSAILIPPWSIPEGILG